METNTQTVYHQMADHNTALLEKICTNDEFSSVIMGLLVQVIRISEVERSKPIEGLTFDPWIVTEDKIATFSSRFKCHSIMLPMTHKWDRQSTFVRYVGQKAGALARALTDNPRLNDWLEELVTAIDNFAKHKGYKFSDLEFTDHIITPTDVVVMKVGKRKEPDA
jgi:hypothetical protein